MSAVCIVTGNLTIVHHTVGEQTERVAAAPPTRSVGGVAAVNCPTYSLRIRQAVELAYILGESDGLEDTHVLAEEKT
jgi:hypothetical protein